MTTMLTRNNSCSISALALAAILLSLTMQAQTPGKDGNKNLNSAEVVNTYTYLTADASPGTLNLNVASNYGFSAGDLVMIYQAQGATIDTSNSAGYGSVTNYNSAGLYELAGVTSVTGSTVITVSAPLSFSYSASGNVQVVRVPQYSRLRINSSGMLTAYDWDGQTGGIVAVHVDGAAIINGTIDASGTGFRGGQLSVNGPSSGDYLSYRSTSATDGAEKGEGIAGPSSSLPGGAYGRGAPANGGGGGNTHNAGGGGGANGNAPSTVWTGQGVMCTSCTGSTAWMLDSAFILNGGYTNSAGGGRGGYTFSMGDQNALTLEPGNTTWGGNYRRERGGLGGHPVTAQPCARIFFGGGGGAGNANNNSGGTGGKGGGIVMIIATSISGSGSIVSNGDNGSNTQNTHNDAPGGGGAGGTIVVSSPSISGVVITANGGNGGSQLITNTEAEGPGGGGGGGLIITSITTVSRTANGGQNGTTSSSALTEFTANGATSGNSGEILTTGCSNFLPVELTSFVARNRDTRIQLEWHTATEMNNFGFEIERRIDEGKWETIGFVDGAGTTNAPREYRYEDKAANAWRNARTVTYRLLQIDRDGSLEYSPTIEVALYGATVSLEMSVAPNPVREAGSIRLHVVDDGRYTISVYNLAGKECATVARDRQLLPGSYSFPLSLHAMPTGAYMIVLQSASGSLSYPFTKL